MKLLIAEDDDLIREGLVDILSAEGFTCLQSGDGESALQTYQIEKPQLVLLDIMMPNKDGYSVCREIRNNDPHTAIIFISAKSEEIDRVLGLELGADDYIIKPFGKHEVLARVRSVVRRYQLANNADGKQGKNDDVANEPREFAIGDLIVNLDKYCAVRADKTIDLSLREIKTLQLLQNNPNKVVTREQLFNYCWGRDYLPSSRTLDQHISTLRKHIEIDPKNPMIVQTVHGVGFRYKALD